LHELPSQESARGEKGEAGIVRASSALPPGPSAFLWRRAECNNTSSLPVQKDSAVIVSGRSLQKLKVATKYFGT